MHSRFRKGQSGNPKGRRRGAKSLATEILEETNERITIREGGKQKRVTKLRGALKSLTNRSIKGDTRATHMLLEHRQRIDERAEANRQEVHNTAEDDAIVEQFLERHGVKLD